MSYHKKHNVTIIFLSEGEIQSKIEENRQIDKKTGIDTYTHNTFANFTTHSQKVKDISTYVHTRIFPVTKLLSVNSSKTLTLN